MATTTNTRQRESVRRADAVANAAERAVHIWWRELIRLLRRAPELGLARFHQAVYLHFQWLPVTTRRAISDGLVKVWEWGDETARRGIPKTVLRRAVAANPRLLQEAKGDPPRRNAPRRVPSRTGPIFADIIPVGILPDAPTVAIPDDLLARVVLRRPTEASIRRRVDNLIAPFLASPRPDLVDPRLHAAQLVQSYAQGKSVDEIAKDLLPIADGVRASARRVARTWGVAVANESQMAAHEQLGPDVVMGYEVRSALTADSREWHKDRHRQQYFRDPGPGQKSFYQLPHPPWEPDDPGERPLGTPQLSWNCL